MEIEPFQNEELMDDTPITTSIEIWKLKKVVLLKVKMKYSFLNLQKLHVQRLFWKPKGDNVVEQN